MAKHCIINVSNGGWYGDGQDRLVKSLKMVGYEGDLLLWKNSYPPNCPTHQEVPYAFKPYAFKEAKRQGYELVLWVDSAVWAIDKLGIVWSTLKDIGYILFKNSFVSGVWTSDACLEKLGKTRDESFSYPHLMACCMGLDLTTDICNEFLDKWFDHANDGISFPGPWSNDNFEASKHPRVKGHRHDQTVASYLTWDLGMRNWLIPRDTFFTYYSAGMKLNQNIKLITQGGVRDSDLKLVRIGEKDNG